MTNLLPILFAWNWYSLDVKFYTEPKAPASDTSLLAMAV